MVSFVVPLDVLAFNGGSPVLLCLVLLSDDDHPDPCRHDAPLGGSLNSYINREDRQPGKPFSQHLRVEPCVHEGSQDHIPADAGNTVEIRDLHSICITLHS